MAVSLQLSRALGPLAQYRSYHLDPVNLRLHLVCVPAIVWSLLVLLALVPAVRGASAAHVLVVAVGVWYVWLAGGLGALAAGVMAGLLAVAVPVAGSSRGVTVALVVFVTGWVVQFVGHARFERLRPAFLTDLRQLFVAPLFVVAELAFMAGWQAAFAAALDGRARELRREVEARRR
jgi:uncharacterized membrane protein YGL010W